MPIQVTPAIPASQIVNDVPSVLAAGGFGLLLSGVMLTQNPRVPIGTLLSFADAADVANYFGATSQEAALGSIYFLGFNNSQIKPSNLFFYQYPWLDPVNAYLRGGSVSGMTLAQLQTLVGTLAVTINGVSLGATINLSGATSFPNAAEIISQAFAIIGPYQGTYVGSISGTTLNVASVTNGPPHATFTGSISGNVLTVTAVAVGTLQVGDLVAGTGVTVGTTIASLGSGQGEVGTYLLSNSMTVVSETLNSYAASGALSIGDVLNGSGIVANTYIASDLSGSGGVGTYGVIPSQNAGNQSFSAYSPGVYYDAIAQAFVIQSGTLGVSSTISFATGTLSTALALTQATGAVTSQGAAQGVPATIMNQVVALSTNWAQFMTLFEPSDIDKENFAIWVNGQNNRYAYAMVDTNIVNTESGGASPAVAAIGLNGYSAVSMIHENSAIDTQGQIGAFVLGYGASIDYTQTQGRATAAFKSQSGLAPQVFDGTIAQNLLSKGMDFYGDYTTADQAFIWYYNGSVTGEFEWLDSYLDQIWYNSNLQLAGMVLLQNTRSIPFNRYGAGLIQAALLDPTIAAVNAGVIQPGVTLSAAQAAEVNGAAGAVIDGVLSTRGWYIQVKIPSAQVRQARGPWPVNAWYTDGQSVQQITINSVLIQ
jgi:hypothetical protein